MAAGVILFAMGPVTPRFAWIAQLVGHVRYEHRAPAFKDNLIQLLVGPVYFIAMTLGWWKSQEDPDAA